MTTGSVTVCVTYLQGYCDFLPEEKLLQAIEVGQVVYLISILPICLHKL